MIDHGLCALVPADVSPTSDLGRALLALNNAHARELSWLEPERLVHLTSEAFLALRTAGGDAFLLAFDQHADYDSPNFLWFRARHERFVYIDRVVVAPAARGRGFARLLYLALFSQARDAGHQRVVCEINSEPPNLASDAFHVALGFVEMGAAVIHGGAKTVRYLTHQLG